MRIAPLSRDRRTRPALPPARSGRAAPPPARGGRAALRLAGALFALLTTAQGCGAPTVARAVDGQIIEGRFIFPHAYALYAVGAEAEARGDLEGALRAFEQAEDSDPDSADIWTRIGAIHCRLGRDEAAAKAFERARAIDPDYEPAHREQARCDLAAGRLEAALARIERAILLDPDRDDGLLLRAEVLRRLGRLDDARRASWELVARRPRSVDAWRALHAVAVDAGDHPTAEHVSRRLLELAPPRRAAAPPLPARPRFDEVDRALLAGQLRRAQRAARYAGLPPAEIAVRAAALGRAREAHIQAGFVSSADPTSTSALVALAVAADLSGDEDTLAQACDALHSPAAGSGPPVPPSPLARLLFAELLSRRIGNDAALTWLGPRPVSTADSAQDPLFQEIAQRLQRELAWRPTAAR